MSKTILLASRDLHLLETRAMLVQFAGYTCLCAATVDAVLADTQAPHLIVLDRTFTRQEQSHVRAALDGVARKPKLICLDELTTPDALLRTIAGQLADGIALVKPEDAAPHVEDSQSPRPIRDDGRKTPAKGTSTEFGKYEFGSRKYNFSCIYLG
jgi:hypothetical protein